MSDGNLTSPINRATPSLYGGAPFARVVTITCLVGEHGVGSLTVEKVRDRCDVAGLLGVMRNRRTRYTISILVVMSPLERASARLLAPFTVRRLLMGANDGAVGSPYQLPRFAASIPTPAPSPAMAPPAEMVTHRLPLAIAI